MNRIEKIVAVPMNIYVALGECQHALRTSTFKGQVGEVGDEVECDTCRQQDGQFYSWEHGAKT